MNKKNKSKHPGTFKGSVDELLEHCTKLNPIEMEKNLVEVNKIESIEHIRTSLKCSKKEAEQIYNEICLSETKKVVDEMVSEGIVEIVGFNEDGEPLFGLTELGKEIQGELDKNK